MILADLVVGGRLRKVLVHFDKNGFAYTLDRATGELLVAEPFANVTWAKGVNRTSGLPIVDTTKITGASRGNVTGICPSLEGGKSPASPASYSPRTGYFYTATNNLCMNFEAAPVTRIAGTPYIGATTPYYIGPGGNGGAFIAWDAARGQIVISQAQLTSAPDPPRGVVAFRPALGCSSCQCRTWRHASMST